jgi:hypothetical protein
MIGLPSLNGQRQLVSDSTTPSEYENFCSPYTIFLLTSTSFIGLHNHAFALACTDLTEIKKQLCWNPTRMDVSITDRHKTWMMEKRGRSGIEQKLVSSFQDQSNENTICSLLHQCNAYS